MKIPFFLKIIGIKNLKNIGPQVKKNALKELKSFIKIELKLTLI